jgi:hypothetical protein
MGRLTGLSGTSIVTSTSWPFVDTWPLASKAIPSTQARTMKAPCGTSAIVKRPALSV